MAKRARVLLVDDHPAFRTGVALLIGTDPELEVVGEAGDAKSGAALTYQLLPDVVVMDMSLPDGQGIAVTRELVSKLPTVNVVGLSAHEEPELARALLEAGAKGYVVKRSAGAELLRAIKITAAGATFLDPSMMRALLDGHRGGVKSQSSVTLSEREAQVIRLVARGFTAKEIAQELELSARTLETYRARAMTKLALHTRAELVRYAVSAGWLRYD